jgi:hypothetical protein
VVKPVKESVIEKYFVEQVENELKGEARKYKTRRNDPDRIVLLPGGRLFFVELKRPGKDAREGQEREHTRLMNLGFEVAVLDTKELVDLWIADKGGKNRCPECGYGLIRLSSRNKRICSNCNITYEWPLNKGQKPVYC